MTSIFPLPSGLNSFSELTDQKLPLTFLAGAGISMGAPSNLPSALAVARILLNFCAVPAEIDKLMSIPTLRYEQIVEEIKEYCDYNLEFLDYFTSVTTPNLIHLTIADQICKGQFAVTTNFDALIEYALKTILPLEEHQQIISVITKADFEQHKDPQTLTDQHKYSIYKLHGSPKNIITNVDTRDSLITTISALGKDREKGETFAIEPFKKPAMHALLKDRVLVVMGYSGRDDFDITPVLETFPDLGGLIWLDHDASRQSPLLLEMLNSTSQINIQDGSRRMIQFLTTLHEKHRYPTYFLQGNTRDIVQTWFKFVEKNNTSSNTQDFAEFARPIYQKVTDLDRYQLTEALYSILSYPNDALRVGESGIALARKANDTVKISMFANNIGLNYKTIGNYDVALQYYEEGLKLCEQVGMLQSKPTKLSNIGQIYYKKGDYDSALKKFQESIKIQDSLGQLFDNPQTRAIDTSNIAMVYLVKGDYDAALKNFEEALVLNDKVGNLKGKAAVLSNMGTIFFNRHELDAALKNFQDAFRIAEQLGNLDDKITYINNIGRIFHEKKDYDLALKYYQEGLQIANQVGSLAGKALVLLNIGQTYNSKGDNNTALNYYQEALRIKETLGDLNGKAICLNDIGWIYKERGDSDAALGYYKQALEIVDKLGDLQNKGIFSGNIGEIYYDKKDYENALKFYLEALEINKKLGDLPNCASYSNSLGLVYKLKGEYDEAIKIYQEAIRIAEELSKIEDKSAYLYNIAKAYDIKGDYDAAIINYQEAIQIVEKMGDIKSLATYSGDIAQAYYFKKNFNQSLKYFQESCRINKQLGILENVALELEWIGGLQCILGQRDEGHQSLQESIAIFRRLERKEDVDRVQNRVNFWNKKPR